MPDCGYLLQVPFSSACACLMWGVVSDQALLEMEGLPDGEFEPDVLACLPAVPWAISEAEVARRRDLRATRHALVSCWPDHACSFTMMCNTMSSSCVQDKLRAKWQSAVRLGRLG